MMRKALIAADAMLNPHALAREFLVFFFLCGRQLAAFRFLVRCVHFRLRANIRLVSQARLLSNRGRGRKLVVDFDIGGWPAMSGTDIENLAGLIAHDLGLERVASLFA
jgi:hypothetical protein